MRTTLALSFILLAACGDDGSSTADTTTDTTAADTTAADTTAADTTAADTTAADTTVADTTTDTTVADTNEADVVTHVDDHGFAIRMPEHRTIPETQPDGNPGTTERDDTDYVCQLDVDGLVGFLYVRTNPVTCGVFTGCTFDVTGAWLSLDGQPQNQPLAGVTYDYGGNHHNDSLSFDNGAKRITIAHSSYGYGYRSCHPPDCARVSSGDTVVDDGCTTDRTIPTPCVRIELDGTEPPIPTTFEKCAGDPNLDPQ